MKKTLRTGVVTTTTISNGTARVTVQSPYESDLVTTKKNPMNQLDNLFRSFGNIYNGKDLDGLYDGTPFEKI